jgi:hypothetical protein
MNRSKTLPALCAALLLAASASAQTRNSVADWNGWVEVLKEGDSMGYRTWVLIPTHPSTW